MGIGDEKMPICIGEEKSVPRSFSANGAHHTSLGEAKRNPRCTPHQTARALKARPIAAATKLAITAFVLTFLVTYP